MEGLEFKVIESASEIADGDYILTVHDGEICKVAKADANLGDSSSSGIMSVIFDYDEDEEEYICNKTYSEIKDAIYNNISIIAYDGRKRTTLVFSEISEEFNKIVFGKYMLNGFTIFNSDGSLSIANSNYLSLYAISINSKEEIEYNF